MITIINRAFNNLSLLVNEGVAHDRLGNYTGAMSYFEKALVINPKNTAALTGKGRVRLVCLPSVPIW